MAVVTARSEAGEAVLITVLLLVGFIAALRMVAAAASSIAVQSMLSRQCQTVRATSTNLAIINNLMNSHCCMQVAVKRATVVF
jgi:hypothetical protein